MNQETREFMYTICRNCKHTTPQFPKQCPKCRSKNLDLGRLSGKEFCEKFGHSWKRFNSAEVRCIYCLTELKGEAYCQNFEHEKRPRILHLAPATVKWNGENYEADFIEICPRCDKVVKTFTGIISELIR